MRVRSLLSAFIKEIKNGQVDFFHSENNIIREEFKKFSEQLSGAVVVLEKGKVAEVGTHDELMKWKGIYHKLITTQRKMSGVKGVSG